MGKKISQFFKGEITSSIFFLLFGICLIWVPSQTLNILCKIVFGLLMIGTGIYHIGIYIAETKNSTILDLLSGVIVLVLGSFLFYNPQIVIKLLPLLLGAFILVDSFWKLRGTIRLKKRGKGVWKLFLADSVIFIGLGIAALINPFAKLTTTILFSGIVFIANGVLDIVCIILLWLGMKVKTEQVTEEMTDAAEESPKKEEMKEENSEEAKEEIDEWKD